MTNLTAAQLTARYNELTNKSIKPTSYSKAVLITMIEALEAAAALPAEETNDHPNGGICPCCGIDYLDNGWQTHDILISEGLEGNKTHQYVCLACGGEFGEPLETEFTLIEAAASLGISAKVARARYRAAHNDGQRTFYKFPRSSWDQVISIISPKRKGKGA